MMVFVRKSIMTNIDGWYVYGDLETTWNLARPRDNIGNNHGQEKLFVTEAIPYMGPDTTWFPLVGLGTVNRYEGTDWDDWMAPEADL